MSSPTPPRADQRPHAVTLHGITREDPYHWLRDPRWQEVLLDPAALDGDIRAYLEAENAYTRAVLSDTEALQEALFEELKARIDEDDSGVPRPDGDWAYYHRYTAGSEYPLHCRCPREGVGADVGAQPGEQVVLDVNAVAAGQEFCRVAGVVHSPDHARLAYAVDTNGSERFTLRVRDLATGEDLPDVIEGTWGSPVVWLDGQTLAYVEIDDHHRPKRVKRHTLGAPVTDDAVLYDEPDDGMFLDIERSADRRYLIVTSFDHTCSEVRVLDTGATDGALTLLVPRQADRLVDVDHAGDHFLLLVREGDAKDGRIARAADADAAWEDVVPHRAGVLLESWHVTADWLIRLETADALPRLVVRARATGEEHTIAFEEAAYQLRLAPGMEWATDVVRFVYSSMTTPLQVFDYRMDSRERTLRKQQRIPSGHDPAGYVTTRLFAPARDGETIPVTLLRRADAPAGPLPTLQYGYGSYGFSMPAGFEPNRLSLVDRGWCYAIAHIRGGKEKGFAWYESAKQANKPRTFDDFVDVARFLCAEGVTAPDRLCAYGGSAGGMLMGAVANQAPEQFAAIVASVPFVDVLNTMCDDTLPLTPPEWPEWGNPLADEAAYRAIAAYSPYDNVAAQDYPALLVLAGLTDPRVTYWEPAKWVARLRERKTGDAPLCFDVQMGAGHAGASGRFEALRKVALRQAFLLKALGLPLE